MGFYKIMKLLLSSFHQMQENSLGSSGTSSRHHGLKLKESPKLWCLKFSILWVSLLLLSLWEECFSRKSSHFEGADVAKRSSVLSADFGLEELSWKIGLWWPSIKEFTPMKKLTRNFRPSSRMFLRMDWFFFSAKWAIPVRMRAATIILTNKRRTRIPLKTFLAVWRNLWTFS